MYGGAAMTILAVAAMTPQPRPADPPVRAAPAAGKATPAAFPYLNWPAAFVPKEPPVAQSPGHFRFWDGTALQDVEGRSYLVMLVGRDGRAFDEARLRGTIEGRLARMGAVRLAAGRVPAATIATINGADRKSLAPGLGDIANDPVQTWTLRRPHRQVWFQYSGNAGQASLAIVEARLD